MSVPKGSSSGKTLRLKGKGVKGGDLLARLQIILPEGDLGALGDVISSNSALFDADLRSKLT